MGSGLNILSGSSYSVKAGDFSIAASPTTRGEYRFLGRLARSGPV